MIDEKFKKDIVKWLIYASFDGRYTGRLESDLYEDISALDEHSYEIDMLIKNLRRQSLSAEDLSGEYDDRHLTLLSILYAINGARDWETKSEDPPKIATIGDKKLTAHHIFPESVLAKNGYEEDLRNDFANITLISKQANTTIKDKEPLTYLEDLYAADPALLKLHFIPEERRLWGTENYRKFLEHRRQLILEAFRKLFGHS